MSPTGGPATSLWDDVVGQPVVEGLRRTAADPAAMTHAWLFTGPPGSGRSVVARAFAAALQCAEGGCGSCAQCREVRAGTHPDVIVMATEGLSIRIAEVREIVARASLRPLRGRWQVVVIEDADRLGEDAADALLLAVEEPATRTVWMLCAPTAEDIVATVRSRCRIVHLRTPPAEDVARHLVVRDGVDPAMAAFAARASQGHIGRARGLATDEQARLRRVEVLRLPFGLTSPGSCLEAAAAIVSIAEQDAQARCDLLDARETADHKAALGYAGSRAPRGVGGALKELEEQQRLRRKRVQRDSVDRALVDVLALYRDVLLLQVGAAGRPVTAGPAEGAAPSVPAGSGLVNEEMRPSLERLARASTPEQTLRRIDAVLAAREAMEANAAPLLALEAMALAVAMVT